LGGRKDTLRNFKGRDDLEATLQTVSFVIGFRGPTKVNLARLSVVNR
jgi:hypothetical protein